ncbi:MAG: holin family protein [Bacteroidota bacterium]
MSIFSKLFGGGLSGVIDSVKDVIDRFTLTKEEKQEFQLEMQSRLMQIEQELEATYRTELESRADIIKAEMTQGDSYTKRARPTVIYTGLAFIFLVYVILPIIAYLSGKSPEAMPEVQLPEEFWWAWATIVSVYGAGRSAEKLGITNKITQLATGSGAYKTNNHKNAVG